MRGIIIIYEIAKSKSIIAANNSPCHNHHPLELDSLVTNLYLGCIPEK